MHMNNIEDMERNPVRDIGFRSLQKKTTSAASSAVRLTDLVAALAMKEENFSHNESHFTDTGCFGRTFWELLL